MEISKFKLLFGKSVEVENQMEISLFYENKMFLSTGQGTYLKQFLPNNVIDSLELCTWLLFLSLVS